MKHLQRTCFAPLSALLLISATGLSATTFAEKPKPGGHHKPPEVAFEACANQSAGDACEFEGRRSELVEGSCTVQQSDTLVCQPDHLPQGEKSDSRPAEQ